jgi:hypothetical protein
MTQPVMAGPYPLVTTAIGIMPNTPGAYCLGSVERGGKFGTYFVGRSDTDIASQLRRHIGNYRAYTYVLAETALGAFQMECEIYHMLSPPDNAVHPVRPSGMDWACPNCGKFG